LTGQLEKVKGVDLISVCFRHLAVGLFSHGCFCFAGYLQLSFLGLDVHKITGKHQAPAGQHQPIQWFAIDCGTNSCN